MPISIALLCERLGWRGAEGHASLMGIPNQTVRDWLAIAELEKERDKRADH